MAAFKEGDDLQPIMFPEPVTDGGKSVLASLQERKTDRRFGPKPLPPQILSNPDLQQAAYPTLAPTA